MILSHERLQDKTPKRVLSRFRLALGERGALGPGGADPILLEKKSMADLASTPAPPTTREYVDDEVDDDSKPKLRDVLLNAQLTVLQPPPIAPRSGGAMAQHSQAPS